VAGSALRGPALRGPAEAWAWQTRPLGAKLPAGDHTSASLTLNENASPDVRRDFSAWFDQAVPERSSLWTHTLEGSDDMPAHIKSSLLGATLTLPLSDGRPVLGTWQGIYLCEHRDHGGPRSLVATVWGEPADRR